MPLVNQFDQHREQAKTRSLLSIVTPAYNEADNLLLLYERLLGVLGTMDLDWEWVVVDDHSADKTFAAIADIARRDSRIRGVRLARNFGSHTAITCALRYARGHCAAVIAADLQDPPEVIPALMQKWKEGYQVVWAVRAHREGESGTKVELAGLYYSMMRRIVGLKEIPPTGADCFLIDRRVLDAFTEFNENNVSILALITWMGFRQTAISYHKQARVHGSSGWSLEKKLKLVLDSITSFTYLPIRLISYLGSAVALAGFIYAAVVFFNALTGQPPQGWTSLMIVVLLVGGTQMIMMGVLGEYLWRALDESRHRPRYWIEATTESQSTNSENAVRTE
jgi:dolichol-phosphate mannosyltransferase